MSEISYSSSKVGITIRPEMKSSYSKSGLQSQTSSYESEKQKYLNRWFSEDEKSKEVRELLKPKTRRPKNTKSISNIERIKRKPNNANNESQNSQNEEEEEKYVKPPVKYPPKMSQATKDKLNLDWVTRLSTSQADSRSVMSTKSTKSSTSSKDFENFVLRQNESARKRIPTEPTTDVRDVIENTPRCYQSKLPNYKENKPLEKKRVFKGKPHLATSYDSTVRQAKQAAIQQEMFDEQMLSYMDSMSQCGRSVTSKSSFSSRSTSKTSNSSICKDIKTFDDIVEEYRMERQSRRYL